MFLCCVAGKKQDHRPRKSYPVNTKHKIQPPLSCKTHKDDQKKSFPRKRKVLDITALKEKDYTEVVHELNESLDRFKFFLKSEEQEHQSDEFIFDLTCTLATVCDAPLDENTNTILAALKGSAFFGSKIPNLLDRLQTRTALNAPESQRRLIGWLIKVFTRYLKQLPSSYADPPYDKLKETLQQSNIVGKDELNRELDYFKQVRDDIIKAERLKHGRRYTSMTGQKPLNDFRDIPICPTSKEIKSHERPFLRKNLRKGRYQDVEHYLDVQFRLLREDFLEPLREGIHEIIHKIPRDQRKQLMKCYRRVSLKGKEMTLSGIIYNVQFDPTKFSMTRWDHSKRLTYGSLLCLSKDNFETMLFATVANRDPQDLAEGRFDIQFIEEQDIFEIEKRQQEYQIVESPAFFEAYRHVLKGLKELDKASMPFQKYLVECSAEVDPPEYLRREDNQDPVCYDLSKSLAIKDATKAFEVPILEKDAWPSVDTLSLNRSQLDALRTALTTEFAVIQGPPGTGKTYVGAKIVRCLLENREQWDADKVSPMLMVCYTNHAVDQFLEKVLEFLPKKDIIRVGGRSKSELLKDCNLKLFTRKYRDNYDRDSITDEIINNQIEMTLETQYCKDALERADKALLEFQNLEAGMNLRHANQFYRAVFPPNATRSCQNLPNTFKLWLCNNTQLNDLNQSASTLMASRKEKDQMDGSILQEDGESKDMLYDAIGAQCDESINSSHFQNSKVASNQQSVKDRLKEKDDDTNETATTVDPKKDFCLKSDQSRLTSSKHEMKREANSFFQDGPPMRHSIVGKGDGEDGSTLQKHIDVFYDTLGAQCDVNIKSTNFQDKVVVTEEQLVEDVPEEKETTETTTGDSNQISMSKSNQDRLSNSKDKMQMKTGGSSMSDPKYEQGDHTVLGASSDNQAEEQGHSLKVLKQPLNDIVHLAVSQEVIEVDPTRHSHEQSRLPEAVIESHPEGERRVSIPDADEETIKVESDATRMQNERCIEGEYEELLVVKLQHLDKVKRPEKVGLVVEETEQWTKITYKKNNKPLIWEKRESRTKDETKGTHLVGHDNNQKKDVATKKRKRKRKDKKTEIKMDYIADTSRIQKQLHKEMMMPDHEAMRVENIWFMSAKDRLRLYLYWVECYRERYRVEIQQQQQQCEEQHKRLCVELEEVKAQEEEEVLQRATVIGMTTSCAARYHSMLQRIAPKIVIIEEAAEVMEAHIITSLSLNTKHTVLIGDHKQLRPKATVYELAREYNLEISLFERMVLNGMECKRLCIQHRMRPEIAALTKRIYEHEIVDHKSVCSFDDICGLRHNLFFIDHCQPDRPVPGLQSFSNLHEVDFLVALCRYLLQQGYKGEQITILTMYTGQLLELKNRLPRRKFEGVKVCVVDNFQGEENDIILLSLVRSNYTIGFLKDSNRICVALSRARQGLYCIGNFTLLRSQCPLWKKICDDLETKNAIGQTLTLVCKRHNNVNEAKDGNDFQNFPLGGCGKVCGERLDCGHACDGACHPTDDYHKRGLCQKKCLRTCPNEHQCQEKCHHPDECFCKSPMVKTIPQCGHEQTVQCYIDPREIICQVKCEKTLQDCEHRCNDVCGRPCTRYCKVVCSKLLPCGHEKNMSCFEDPKINSECNRNCNKILDCGHPCSKKCKEKCHCNTPIEVELPCKHQINVLCPEKDQPLRCIEKCQRELQCGHECPGLCCEECTTYQCKRVVEKLLPCEHNKLIPCYLDPHYITCQELCQKKCLRGHSCQQRCHFGTPCKDCKVVVNMTMSSCKHDIEMPCSWDPASLVCKKPCERLRLCGHACRNVCGKNCEARPCMKRMPRTLPCKHRVTLACHKNPETYKCKANVVVNLPCGHGKSMDCCVANGGIQNELCNKKVEKDLPCKHKVVLPCHSNPEVYKCKRKVEVKMTCGHTKSVICSSVTAETQQLCMVLMTRTLPCEHKVTIPCYEIVEEYNCQEKVEVTLPCEHIRHVECSKREVLEDEKCETVVKEALPCGHEKGAQCFVKPEGVYCDAPCERVLFCKHPCPGRCGDDCRNLKCAVKVEKNLACGYHKQSCLCSDDVSQIICLNKCERKLPCGHNCIGKCSEACGKYNCKVMVMKNLSCPKRHNRRMPCHIDPAIEVCSKSCERKLNCGHRCKEICGQPCETVKCMRKVDIKFPCGHKKKLSCFQRETAICRQPCSRRKGTCQHLCKGWCGEPCSKYPCKVPVVKTLPCGHNIKMHCCDIPECVECPADCGASLPCGHQCSRMCRDCTQSGSHGICQNSCSRLLVCLHRCRATCSLPCPPCVRNCTRKCPHKKCNHPCSEPCDPCKQPCMWSCPHYQCNNLCWEECARPPCDAPCPKKLRCGHPCIGLCGDSCPTLCAICHAKKLSSILVDEFANKEEPTRCLQLFDCSHIIKVEKMDAWMREVGNDVQLVRCPKCSTAITFSFRYGNLIKRTLKNIENVKAQVKHLADEVAACVHFGLRGCDVNKLKFPETVLKVAQSYPNNIRQIHNCDILFMFTLKNHLVILEQVQITKRVLTMVRTVEAKIKQQPEVDKALNIITDGLKDISEYLKQPQLQLTTLSYVHEQTRKLFLFSRVLEAQSKAKQQQLILSNITNKQLKSAHDQLRALFEGNDHALNLEWLGSICNSLRTEVRLPLLPPKEEKDFANFPGYSVGVWKLCMEGHVYYTALTVRGGKEILIGSEGCTQCRAIDSDQNF